MSMFLGKTAHQKMAAMVPEIRSESDLTAQRDHFREITKNKDDLEIIFTIYESLRSIRDPEHPYTLEQLNVINMEDIEVIEKGDKHYVTVYWRPIYPTCNYANHIGLAMLIKLERELNNIEGLKILFLIKPGGHKQKTISKKFHYF